MLELCAESGAGLTAAAWTQPADVGLIGRCVREGEPVRIASTEQFRGNEATRDVRSELVVPIRSGGSLWGALNLEHTAIDFFGAGDLRMVEAIAAQLGGALRALDLYESLWPLRRHRGGTVGRPRSQGPAHRPALGLDRPASGRGRPPPRHGRRRSFRSCASGPCFTTSARSESRAASSTSPARLTETERRHGGRAAHGDGKRILARVEFLKPVLPLVRHAHISAGRRLSVACRRGDPVRRPGPVVCDAHDAMTTDRPYRQALTPEDVRRELLAGAGTQFDPAAVEALLVVLAAAATSTPIGRASRTRSRRETEPPARPSPRRRARGR